MPDGNWIQAPTSSKPSSFGPEAVESTAELVNLYGQVWRENVAPLSSHPARSANLHSCDDHFEDSDDNMSLASMTSSSSLDLLSDAGSIELGRRRVRTPEPRFNPGKENMAILIGSSDDAVVDDLSLPSLGYTGKQSEQSTPTKAPTHHNIRNIRDHLSSQNRIPKIEAPHQANNRTTRQH
ncbi:expressed unknown protein [Seminavis robusta]|uniref:Uncharacterized protein n=1 Tax=Seminavis robusta TaxID=568900 RepID=A0A9N8H5J6_9STRA|nr:expressed unknown protein [Seminavis robusta]|eukprot:Sro144_g067070.1 n/a (181) ;mRNA; r:74464-75006